MEQSPGTRPASGVVPGNSSFSAFEPSTLSSDELIGEHLDQPSLGGQRQSSATRPSSHIWQSAINKYYDELKKGGIKGPAIEKDLWNIKSPMALLDQIRALEPSDARRSKAWLGSLCRLETILPSLNDFAVVSAWALGMNGKVAAIFWGSIRLLLSVKFTVYDSTEDSY